MFNKYHLSFIIAFLFLQLPSAWAQEKPGETKLKLDPNVKVGQLDNGLKYFIMKNAKPKNRVELRLAVNAGSILEDDNQQGLAHFVEHMAFNGSKNFKKNELVNFLEKSGVNFGTHLNAYTSFDETVYMLQLPTDKPELLDKGFLVLEDWAAGVLFDSTEVEKERGVVIEEWRLGLGAQQRMRTKTFPIIFKNSKYAVRLPIGKKNILEKFYHERLKTFYKDWYRPDLMAVVVVGDIDPVDIENKIKAHFSKLKNPKNEKERKKFEVPLNGDKPLVAIATDKEAPFNMISMVFRQKAKDILTEKDMYDVMVRDILDQIVYSRIHEQNLKSEQQTFVFSGSGYGGSVRPVEGFSLYGGLTDPKKLNDGMGLFLTEIERIKRFGVKASEMERAKKQLMADIENEYKEKGKTESRRLVGSLVYYFLKNDPFVGTDFEYDFYKKYLESVTLDEVNGMVKKVITGKNLVITINMQDKEGITPPTESEILQMIEAYKKVKLSDYQDSETTQALIENLPKPGTIVSSKILKDLDTKKLVLSNGATIYYKKTDYKDNEIKFTAFSDGGSSLYKDNLDNYRNAGIASGYMMMAGYGPYDMTAFSKYTSGMDMSVRPYVSTYSEGINGKSVPKDFETALQLMHLTFTNIRKDEKAFKQYVSQMIGFLPMMENIPNFYLSLKYTEWLHNNSPFYEMTNKERLEKLNFEKVYKFTNERFANPGDFTFVFVGNIGDDFEQLITKYIASIPGKSQKEKYQDMGIPKLTGSNQKDFFKGSEDKSMVKISTYGETKYSAEENFKLRVTCDMLKIKLREIMREDEGGVYGVGVSGSIGKVPKGSYSVNISFGCAPKNVSKLVGICKKEMKKAVKKPMDTVYLEKVKAQLLSKHEENLQKNSFWLNRIADVAEEKYSEDFLAKYESMVNALTLKDIHETAKYYFSLKNIAVGVLKPEKK